jgi:hypothetical protein
MAKRQTTRGPRGHRGSVGARGLTGPIGRRGKIGKPGSKGPKGVTGPLHKDNVLDMVMAHFDDVYLQLNIQMKRMAQIQQQVDVLIANVEQLRRTVRG